MKTNKTIKKYTRYVLRVIIAGIIPFLLCWNAWANRASIFTSGHHSFLDFIGFMTIMLGGSCCCVGFLFCAFHFLRWVFFEQD